MIIDCHGHYTTAPAGAPRLSRGADSPVSRTGRCRRRRPTSDPGRRDPRQHRSEPAEAAAGARQPTSRIFSPRASAMAHHIGDDAVSLDLDARLQRSDQARRRSVSRQFRRRLPAAAVAGRADREACIPELERCVTRAGFIGCNLNPDPSGGHWTSPPLTDRHWYPLYEKMVELRRAGDGACQRRCNPNLSRHRRPLHQRRHYGLHAVHDVGSVQRFPDAEVHHSARRRRGAVSLGPLPRAGADAEAAAADGACDEQRLSSIPASITSRASIC